MPPQDEELKEERKDINVDVLEQTNINVDKYLKAGKIFEVKIIQKFNSMNF